MIKRANEGERASAEDHSLLQYSTVTMRRSRRRPQPPSSGPRNSGVQKSDGPSPPERKRLQSAPPRLQAALKHSPELPSHTHAGADVAGWRLGVVGATVGVCWTVSEERKSAGGFRGSRPEAAAGLTSNQAGQRAEVELLPLDEHRAAVQAAVALPAEGVQGHLVTFELPVAERRGGTDLRLLFHAVVGRSDEFHPSSVQHPKPDGQSSCLTGLTLDVHLLAFLQRSQLLRIRRGQF